MSKAQEVMEIPIYQSREDNYEKQYKWVAKQVQEFLLNNDFIVHRYNAYSTNSIYLKIDCGLCKFIRISDHRGKGYLRYTYNILKDVNSSYSVVDNGVLRYYVSFDNWKEITCKIMECREDLIGKYGSNWYSKEVNKRIKNFKSMGKGFWTDAYLVKRGEGK